MKGESADAWGERRRSAPSLAVGAEFNLIRYVPLASPTHRLWAGTKLLVVAAVSIAIVSRPTWPSVAIGWSVVVLGFIVSNVRAAALPQPPRGLAIGCPNRRDMGTRVGRAPFVHVARSSLGPGWL